MKGISRMAVVLVVIIILAVILLYVAWTRGWLYFIKPASEAQCYSDVQKACSNAQTIGDYTSIRDEVQKCQVYISANSNLGNCASCAKDGTNCKECCQNDLPKWTPA